MVRILKNCPGSPESREKKNLFDQNGIDYAVLAGAAYNPCATEFGVNNCALGKEISPYVVGVCPVFLYLFDLYFLCLSG